MDRNNISELDIELDFWNGQISLPVEFSATALAIYGSNQGNFLRSLITDFFESAKVDYRSPVTLLVTG